MVRMNSVEHTTRLHTLSEALHPPVVPVGWWRATEKGQRPKHAGRCTWNALASASLEKQRNSATTVSTDFNSASLDSTAPATPLRMFTNDIFFDDFLRW